MFDAGAIEVNVSLKEPERCRRIALSLFNTRTEAAAAALTSSRSRADARRLITLIYGLCPIAHLTAFDEARLAALGRRVAPERRQLRELAVALEGLVETTRVMTAGAAPLAGIKPEAETLRTLGSLRAELAAIAEHLLALDPIDAQDSPEKTLRRRALLAAGESVLLGATNLAQTAIYGMAPDEFMRSAESAQAFSNWAHHERERLPAAKLFVTLLALPRSITTAIDPLPGPEACIASGFADELLHRMLKEPGFALSPFLDGAPALTGSAVRLTGCAAMDELRRAMGLSPAVLLAARLLEAAQAFGRIRARIAHLKTLPAFADPTMDAVEAADEKDASGASFPAIVAGWGDGSPSGGAGLGLADTARGLLAHAAVVEPDGLVRELRITSPTEWQFATNGAGQRLVVALAKALPMVLRGDSCRAHLERLVGQVLFGLDACVPVRITFAKEALAKLAEQTPPAAPR